MKKLTVCVITLVAVLNTSACGYFLYPERVGNTSGKIDPAVVILDAAGLFLGVIPGVVAFAVDLTTGAIYLSPGERSTIEKHDKRLGLTGDATWQKVNRANTRIDSKAMAGELSSLVGRQIEPAEIQFYTRDELDHEWFKRQFDRVIDCRQCIVGT